MCLALAGVQSITQQFLIDEFMRDVPECSFYHRIFLGLRGDNSDLEHSIEVVPKTVLEVLSDNGCLLLFTVFDLFDHRFDHRFDGS